MSFQLVVIKPFSHIEGQDNPNFIEFEYKEAGSGSNDKADLVAIPLVESHCFNVDLEKSDYNSLEWIFYIRDCLHNPPYFFRCIQDLVSNFSNSGRLFETIRRSPAVQLTQLFEFTSNQSTPICIEVYIAGFPNGYIDYHYLSPLLQKCNIAADIESDVDGKPIFVVDKPVFGGASGSPVFMLRNNQIYLIGIIYENFARNYKMQPQIQESRDQSHSSDEAAINEVHKGAQERIEIPVVGYALKAHLLKDLHTAFDGWISARFHILQSIQLANARNNPFADLNRVKRQKY